MVERVLLKRRERDSPAECGAEESNIGARAVYRLLPEMIQRGTKLCVESAPAVFTLPHAIVTRDAEARQADRRRTRERGQVQTTRTRNRMMFEQRSKHDGWVLLGVRLRVGFIKKADGPSAA